MSGTRAWFSGVAVLVLAGVAMLGCGKDKGPAFIFDGLYLEYAIGESSICRLEFSKVGDDVFLLKRDPEHCSVRPDGMTGAEMRVTGWLESEGGKRLIWGEYMNLWIPPDARKAGAQSVFGGQEKIEIGQLEERTVAIINAKIALLEGKWYYDVKTGFLVGFDKTFVGESHVILRLLETNAGK